MPSMKTLRDRLDQFGAAAVVRPDVDELLQVACQEIADALNVSHVKALEYLPGEKSLLIRAGVGWSDHVVGEVRLAAGFECAAGFTLQTGKPTISEDLLSEQRFHVPQLLFDHGVRSVVNVLIKFDDLVFGVLEADSDQARHFGDEDIQTLQGFANVLALVIAQARTAKANYELSVKLETLLRELAHRTRNNNQLLMSMVSLQKAKATIMEVVHALDDVLARITVLNAIDELLSFVDDTEFVDVPSYINSLSGKIFSSLSDSSQGIRLVTDLEDGVLTRSVAQSVAVIVNEFITNSFKYAFKDGGVLSIRMQIDKEMAVFELADDGPGIPASAQPGLGSQIMDAMAAQIDAKLDWLPGPGAKLRLLIPRATPPSCDETA
ncbi:MAG: GAF domain-containing protein [Rhodospirillales bacterium]|nr:GAF domain-containing protein [Rhodospirillales bacterium]